MKSDFLWGVATSAFQIEGSEHADWASWEKDYLHRIPEGIQIVENAA